MRDPAVLKLWKYRENLSQNKDMYITTKLSFPLSLEFALKQETFSWNEKNNLSRVIFLLILRNVFLIWGTSSHFKKTLENSSQNKKIYLARLHFLVPSIKESILI